MEIAKKMPYQVVAGSNGDAEIMLDGKQHRPADWM